MLLASVFILIIVGSFGLAYAMHPKVIARMGPNAWVGLRLPRIMSSDESWLRGHQIAWPWVLGGTALPLALYVLGLVFSLSGTAWELPAVACLIAGSLLASILYVAGAVVAEKELARSESR